ncbi:hypothetical protein [Sphingobacterium sp. UGAL515B_05]|uniref:hypothetical protein n=1 Tax=Sphingobacterium sp. UGAL515B_05 TaxID=2986767 RepID=UPI002955495D|nr:hypothetical protein [Sphingobacterium sp. UGAL515B_05]WON93800.1 hypothetical protein OK025_21440 [Sphingobacterium sp. UGAL515B_05]
MIIQDISYAITGEAIPITGLKIDVSKPEGTISGAFPIKNLGALKNISFDIKGGVTGQNFNLFKGFKNVSGAFEARPSFHLVPSWSSGKYGYPPKSTQNKLLVIANNHLVDKEYSLIKDSLNVIRLLKEYHTEPLTNIKSKTEKKRKKQDENHPVKPFDLTTLDSLDKRKIAIYFVNKICKDVKPALDENASKDDILNRLGKVEVDANASDKGFLMGYKQEVYTYYKLYTSRSSYETQNKLKIQNSADLWTKKSYYWFTLSPFIRGEGINAYHNKYQGLDSLYFKSENSWYYGGTAMFNLYHLYPKRFAHFLRASITLSHSNNLAALSPFGYETTAPMFQAGNSVTQKTSSGTAYTFDQIRYGFLKSASIDYYFLPLKTFIPGAYISTNFNNSKLYNLVDYVGRENDSWLIGAEGGLIFNINSRESGKEKNILSILTYIRNEDVTDKRRTSVKTGIEESSDDFNKRNWRIGLKVGIPINLPQR